MDQANLMGCKLPPPNPGPDRVKPATSKSQGRIINNSNIIQNEKMNISKHRHGFFEGRVQISRSENWTIKKLLSKSEGQKLKEPTTYKDQNGRNEHFLVDSLDKDPVRAKCQFTTDEGKTSVETSLKTRLEEPTSESLAETSFVV